MSALGARLAELRLAAMVLTRLPMGRLDPAPTLGAARWAFPLVGACVGLIGWSGFAAALALGASPAMAACVCLGAMALATGGLHFDGLADMADGIGGGRTPEDRLHIMRDSRIGSYGTLALILSVGMRWQLIGALGTAAPAALVAAAILSRGGLPVLMHALPPARLDGLGHDAGRGVTATMALASVILAVILALIVAGALKAAAAMAGAALALMLVARLARRQIGGQTGDVLGAAQQAAEIAALIGIAAL